ncbi:MAG: hypothetical protein JWO86_6725 [Myxococcaceae bacterium]|nr:hypothetical protein [Myxococcaceae bacterium]
MFSLGILASFALASGDARADEATAADIASARKIGFEGIQLAEKGNCTAAIDKLARAEKLFHAPTTLGRLGECQVLIGKIVEGTENLGRVAREELASNAPAAFVTARARARKQLAAATPKLAHAKIIVKAPSDATVSVTVDSAPVNAANLGEDRVLDPGPHVVEATAPGYFKAHAEINLQEGGSEQVTLKLIVDPEAARAARVAAPTTPSSSPSTSSPPSSAPGSDTQPPGAEAKGPNRTLAYVVLGVGVVGLGLGTVFGLSAMSKKNDLSNACPNKICRASEQSNLDSAKTSGTISTIAFGVGGAAVILGGVLFFTAPSSSSSSSSSTAIARPAPPARLVARPYFDITSAGVAGSF